jgi:hypothetical protein
MLIQKGELREFAAQIYTLENPKRSFNSCNGKPATLPGSVAKKLRSECGTKRQPANTPRGQITNPHAIAVATSNHSSILLSNCVYAFPTPQDKLHRANWYRSPSPNDRCHGHTIMRDAVYHWGKECLVAPGAKKRCGYRHRHFPP